MSHLTDDELKAWLAFSNNDAEDAATERHLQVCVGCAKRLEQLGPDDHPMLLRLRQIVADSSDHRNFDTLDDTNTSRTIDGISETHTSAKYDGKLLVVPDSDSHLRWQPVKRIASGGIGEVWLAKDRSLGKPVALKRLRPQVADQLTVQRRFIHEAQITAQMDHPGTVHVYDLCEAGSDSYYVMSLVNGETLHEKINRLHSRLKVPCGDYLCTELIDLIRNWTVVARTIAYAHSRSVLHRDLKSDNIIVGEYGQVTVIDWGLAKRFDESSDSLSPPNQAAESTSSHEVASTHLGARLGTPAFMAPEQARGDVDQLDQRTDTYALSAMLYEILTGQAPFQGDSAETVMQRLQVDPLRPPADFFSEIPEQLNWICVRGMSKSPEDRFQTAADLADATDEWMLKEDSRRHSDLARQRLFELSDDVMVILDGDPKITWANQAWERKLGWKQNELLGLRPADLIHPDDIPPGTELQDSLGRGESVAGLRRRVKNRDGKYYWFTWSATPLPEEGISVAVGKDIDDLVQQRQEIDEFLAVAPEAIAVVNLDRRIHRLNEQTNSMFGYVGDELKGQLIDVLIPTPYHRVLHRFFDDYMANVESRPLLTREGLLGRHKDGSQFELDIRLNPVKNGDGYRIVSSIRKS